MGDRDIEVVGLSGQSGWIAPARLVIGCGCNFREYFHGCFQVLELMWSQPSPILPCAAVSREEEAGVSSGLSPTMGGIPEPSGTELVSVLC